MAALALKGYIQKIKPRYIIIECVERNFPEIAGWNTNISENTANKFLYDVKRYGADNTSTKNNMGFFPPIMMKTCVRFVIDKLFAMTHHGHISLRVKRASLNEELFAGLKESRTLYYYADDLNYLGGEFDIKSINEALNTTNKFAADNNTSLIFLGVPNKHSVYLPYITSSDSVPENTAFMRLEAAKKDYIFVNVKDIIAEAMSTERIQDLYWGDDTHWSYKTHKLVGDYLAKLLLHAD